MELQTIKNRFEIVGNSPALNHALETAVKVAPTDMSVLITGESGVGKESFSKIIHALSSRKHGNFIAVNCGAIPEGTIDSELFGHEKGSFTGATDARKGYFEAVNGGTIFLDEVGELPLGTQARLLRVLENGEFIKVGSSKVLKTNVRVVAATNRDLLERAGQGKFREDLYYRLATVPIRVPRLSERKEDINILFRKFATLFAEKNHSPVVQLDNDAQQLLANYTWPGNIRQLKNITEQICVLESENNPVSGFILQQYLPQPENQLPLALSGGNTEGFGSNGFSERDIFYKFLIDMKKDVSDLKRIVMGLIDTGGREEFIKNNRDEISHVLYKNDPGFQSVDQPIIIPQVMPTAPAKPFIDVHQIQEVNNLTIAEQELDMIKKALQRNHGKRNKAAKDLGISERTLYRKIKYFELE
ncbi:MAG: sigma-54 dependent transcriptional regulator [Bacteroidota bacterium]